MDVRNLSGVVFRGFVHTQNTDTRFDSAARADAHPYNLWPDAEPGLEFTVCKGQLSECETKLFVFGTLF
jgi:hypothetical protein